MNAFQRSMVPTLSNAEHGLAATVLDGLEG